MRSLVLLFGVVALSLPASAQNFDFKKLPGAGGRAKSFEDLAGLEMSISPAAAKRGERVVFKLVIAPKPGSYTYAINPPAGQDSPNVLKLPARFVEADGAIVDPPGWKDKPGALQGTIDRIYTGVASWEIPLTVNPSAPVGKTSLSFVGSRLQACNDSGCFPTNKLPSLDFEVLPGDPVPRVGPPPVKVTPVAPIAPKPEAHAHVTKPAVATPEYQAQMLEVAGAMDVTPITVGGGFVGLIVAAVLWGFVSLATPCVFPMIPITVSLFLKQSNQTTSSVLRLALIYCLTIIAVLGSSAVFLLAVFQKLSVDPYMNLFLAGLFIFFALSLFGMYDISLPNFLLQGADRGRRAGGTIGTVFGAVAFSIVSFTCVAPFLGGFAGLAASGNYTTAELALAGIAFATAFASPFFVLALFPTLLKKLPRSGGWLDTVKAVMGFLELAAALKFLRTAELRLFDKAELITYDVALAAWVGIFLVAGLYLLNLFRLPHDDEKPNVGVLRMLFGLGAIVFSVHLIPGLFPPQRPAGTVYAWVNSFLLPDPGERAKGLSWGTDLKAEVDRIVAEKVAGRTPERGLIFIDFTGLTCTNCTLNENNVFPLPAVSELLRKYALVKLYTDEVPAHYYTSAPTRELRNAEARANQNFQDSRFGTLQLPLYVILDPQADGRVVVKGVYDEGKINNVPRFVEFLTAPLAK